MIPVEGHAEIRAALAGAAYARRLPHSLLLHGPAGIGKQRLALWLGQLRLCRNPAALGPCDQCHPCHLASRLEHPDLHWFFPLPRPGSGGSSDRLGEALEIARAAELGVRRAQPLRPTLPEGLTGIYHAHVQVLLRSAQSRPAMGSHKVFVIGDAEGLMPQEASQEAANALLKLLEEPPADTTVVLTAADPDILLPTIRSRLLTLRLRPLPLDQAAAFLQRHAGSSPDDATRAAALAQGSIGRALGFLNGPKGDVAPLEEVRLLARQWLEAALATEPLDLLARAHSIAPAGARGAFSDTLAALTLWLRDLAAAATGADDLIVNLDARDWLVRSARSLPGTAAALPTAMREVEATLQLTQLNINPQLALASLLQRLRTTLSAA